MSDQDNWLDRQLDKDTATTAKLTPQIQLVWRYNADGVMPNKDALVFVCSHLCDEPVLIYYDDDNKDAIDGVGDDSYDIYAWAYVPMPSMAPVREVSK